MKRRTLLSIIIPISILFLLINAYITFFGVTPYAPFFLSKILDPQAQINDFNKNDRILIVAPHPDDEILSSAGVIQRALSVGAKVKVLYLTLGDHNITAFWLYEKHPILSSIQYREMGDLRRDEAIEGTSSLGLNKDDLIFLGYPDYETLNIWENYWNPNTSAFDHITRTSSVPYENAYRYKAKYNSTEVLKDFKTILKQFDPTIVIYPTHLDINPDHQSASLFSKVAILETGIHPIELQYLVHQKSFPRPLFYNPASYLLPPDFYINLPTLYKNFDLTSIEEQKKYQALLKYKTQLANRTEPFFLTSFVRRNELFLNEDQVLISSEDSTFYLLPSNFLFGKFRESIKITDLTINKENSGSIIVNIKTSQPLKKSSIFRVYFFPYKDGMPFQNMTKLLIEISGGKDVKIRDIVTNKIISNEIHFEKKDNTLNLKIPESLVNNADRFFIHFQSGFANFKLYRTPWQLFEINN